MRTIAFTTQKGGSGKSTLAIDLAVAAMQEGERVIILDTDRQGTVSHWRQRRADPEPVVEQIVDDAKLERLVHLLGGKGFTLAVIDTPATENAAATAATRVADLCLIPVRPSAADIEATLPTLHTIRALHKEFAFVLNQAPARSYRPTKTATALNTRGVLALPFIVERADHQDALEAGLGVTEFAPNGKACQEIRALWACVKGKLDRVALDPVGFPIAAPFHAMVLQSLRLASLAWMPWLRAEDADDLGGRNPGDEPSKPG
ncbi:MAG TPA: AAA family ATPase [Xanthobacteraceae bacterium]